MFSQLSTRITQTVEKIRGIGRLTDANMNATLTDIKKALIEADVALPVVKKLIKSIKEKASGQKIIRSIRPGEALIKIVKDELVDILGESNASLDLKASPPVVILMAGLQGTGKTTTLAKLANWLKQNQKKSVMVASTDVNRPAAIKQLEVLADQIDVEFFPSDNSEKPTNIAQNALAKAKKSFCDVLLIDTAGRLHIDDELMSELSDISDICSPKETLLVVDSMGGQDAANMAKTFNEQLSLSGIILTKTDGDSRGGAALSMRMITEKPIKFIGVGEKIEDLEPFHPDRIASRILGMGDVVSLVEKAQEQLDEKQAAKLTQKIKKGKRFDFNDFLDQLAQLKKMGGLQSMLGKLPTSQLPKGAASMMDDKSFVQMEAIIQSMTLKERQFPALINGSRKKRIASGSGNKIQDVNKLLKQFTQMQKMMKRFKGDKMMKKMAQLKGQLPPELLDNLPDDD